MNKKKEEAQASRFRLGIFGDTGAGKTVYMTAWYWAAQTGQLPEGINVRPADNYSARYLGDKVALIRSGEWPRGTVDSSEWIKLLIDESDDTVLVRTRDFRGGDFGEAFYRGGKEQAEKFVFDLFDGCNAYIFLVDPCHIKKTFDDHQDKDAQKTREGIVSGILPALEILRRKSKLFKLYHRPVAVVFTKCDLHPEILEAPEEFAKKYLHQTYLHLRNHAPDRHAFFGISCTGEKVLPEAPPPPQLKPINLFKPIAWAKEVHKRRRRFWIKVASVVLIVFAALGYCLGWNANRNALNRLKRDVETANYEELRGHYGAALDYSNSFWLLLTHPLARRTLPRRVISRAVEHLEQDVPEPSRELSPKRTTEIRDSVRQFINYYSGTAEAKDYENRLRRIIDEATKGKIDRLLNAANDRNEERFQKLINGYRDHLAPLYEEKVQDAKVILIEVLLGESARDLYTTRIDTPSDIERVLRAQERAKREMDRRNIESKLYRKFEKYITLVGRVYSAIQEKKENEGGLMATVVRTERQNGNEYRWSIRVDGDTVLREEDWQEGDTEVAKEFPVNVFAKDAKMEFRVSQKRLMRIFRGNKHYEEKISLEEAINQHDFAIPKRDERYTFIIAWGDIKELYAHIKQIREFENELF